MSAAPSDSASTTAVHETDVAIIGAGPVGLFAVFECGMLRMRCHVVDALDTTGGQCAALYPEKPIYDIPGYPEIEAAELIRKLEAQAAPFHPTYHLGQQVERLTPRGGGWLLETSAGTRIAARAVIVAAGVGAFGPNRPPLEGIEAHEGRSVFYYVKRRADLAGKRVVIAGGGDSAVDWALALAGIAASVQVVHRRAKFRAAPESVARMEALAGRGDFELVIPYQLARLEGCEGRLEAVVVTSMDDGKERHLPCDVLLPFFGLAMNLGPVARWGLNLDRNHVRVEPATCATNVPGIFAIGDIATYPGKLKLILSGFAEAAMAAHAIHPLVFPGEALHFEYSTTKGVTELA
ncbi:MAG: NAD(P)/FAD-dependent oxidoreductase [Rhodospirillaceae bacterium]|nr:NAD(P)/FAD-dependent oxidoreductase [Rhodospirillaceae bacterium]